jgi:N-acetyl-gamma-glutamyl-phosphate reductase
MKRVFIVGGEGTTGLRLHQRLVERRDLELVTIKERLRKDAAETLRLIEQSDFAFLCLPEAAAREIAALSADMDTKLIDASTAHRVEPGWAYGFPELGPDYREALGQSKRAAAPGCHASGYIALVRPLVEAGILTVDSELSCTSLTGYSGGGKQMIAQYEDTNRSAELGSPKLYAMGQEHKHLPEMCVHSGVAKAPVFLPVVGDFYSGMLVTVPLRTQTANAQDIREVYRRHYAASAIVKVSGDEPTGLFADAMSGRDDMLLYVSGTEGRFLLTAVFDNLGKGASGAAIQCFNLMSGLPEETGLVIKP